MAATLQALPTKPTVRIVAIEYQMGKERRSFTKIASTIAENCVAHVYPLPTKQKDWHLLQNSVVLVVEMRGLRETWGCLTRPKRWIAGFPYTGLLELSVDSKADCFVGGGTTGLSYSTSSLTGTGARRRVVGHGGLMASIENSSHKGRRKREREN
ncbi:conserved hypothetical protein [Ricinus communis]|uniref:Uncharacterized protein n=1 Tax=Ricinus communis TaxID=3988 RepID=B9SGG9_RICCO|nr:conserved hypothetical protein [Ricinus communis]